MERDINLFKEIQIAYIQITLDGTKETHNQRRPHLTDNDSYTVILNNIDKMYHFAATSGYSPGVSIRVNIDKRNKGEFISLKKNFYEKYGDHFLVYYGIVKDINTCMDSPDCALSTLDQVEFIRELHQEYGYIDSYSFPYNHGSKFCGAQNVNTYVIDPEGYMYKCWNDIGDKSRAVSSLISKMFQNPMVESSYLLDTHVSNIDECLNCLFTYICHGGCPHKRLALKDNSILSDLCHVMKGSEKEFLEKYYEQKQSKEIIL